MEFSLLKQRIDQGERIKGDIWTNVDREARQGDREAQFILGYRWYRQHGPAYKKAVDWLRKAATAGHLEAVQLVAEIDEGLNLSRRLLQEHAEAGESSAQLEMATLLATNSDGLGQDLEQSRRWYFLAAEQNEQTAQYNLGLMLLRGEGGPVHTPEGIGWLEKAASGTNPEVSVETAGVLADLYEAGASGLPSDPERASFWRNKAEQG
ncbi:MAG: sel1 repeat family protein [Candidatus Eremiobacteraeota bacterium]|nr:sel1 repeat family protein [Candidatus Eremiobacteraeota bacterium]MCW5866540.1 sel1 repeat family protein [Candidatus Eremiobacteraeota bacterium]